MDTSHGIELQLVVHLDSQWSVLHGYLTWNRVTACGALRRIFNLGRFSAQESLCRGSLANAKLKPFLDLLEDKANWESG